MQKLLYYLFFLAGISFLSGCYTDPDFADEPFIELKNLELIRTITTDQSTGFEEVDDKLAITVYYEDGNGDLGLTGDILQAPYNEYNFNIVRDVDGNITEESQFQEIGDDGVPPGSCSNTIRGVIEPFTNDERGLPVYDTEGSSVKNFVFITEAVALAEIPDETRIKNYYVDFNERYYNFLVKLEVEQPSGSGNFIPIDLGSGNSCQSLNARFPFDPTFFGEPVSGTITYAPSAIGLFEIYKDRRLNAKIKIFDLAGNASDEIETGPFILEQKLRIVRQ